MNTENEILRENEKLAMPLDKCFQIIEEGSGQDFEPLLAEVFLDIRDKVEEVHDTFAEEVEIKNANKAVL